MKTISKMQQGDVLFLRVGTIPTGAKKSEATIRGYILAEGETTGHAHVCPPQNVTCYVFDGVIYLSVKKSTIVTHEEHGKVTIPKGIWEIGRVQEVDPFKDEVRQVAD